VYLKRSLSPRKYTCIHTRTHTHTHSLTHTSGYRELGVHTHTQTHKHTHTHTHQGTGSWVYTLTHKHTHTHTSGYRELGAPWGNTIVTGFKRVWIAKRRILTGMSIPPTGNPNEFDIMTCRDLDTGEVFFFLHCCAFLYNVHITGPVLMCCSCVAHVLLMCISQVQ
jgi:hypothetical protein